MPQRLRIEPTDLPDCVNVHLAAHPDERGSFRELFRSSDFAKAGIDASVAQVNASRSKRGVVRGLHFQFDPPMAKAMRVTRGAAFVVAVDVRKGSPTCGRAFWQTMRELEDRWLVAPAGFARGLQALEDDTEVEYLCSAEYRAEGEGGILWNDPKLGIPWPMADATVSAKDRAAPALAAWLAGPHGGAFAR